MHFNRGTTPQMAQMGLETPPNTLFLGRTAAHSPNGIPIGLSELARLTGVTDRQTDRQTDRLTDRHGTSVTMDHIYALLRAMRPKIHAETPAM